MARMKIDGQIGMVEFLNSHKSSMTCSGCICKDCLLYNSGRCPYGGCYDEKRAKDYPFDKAHPERTPRTLWSNWNKEGEQAHWCRGGSFTHALVCDSFIPYDDNKTIVKECLNALIVVFQDGYISCSLVDTMGCEECYRQFNSKGEDE